MYPLFVLVPQVIVLESRKLAERHLDPNDASRVDISAYSQTLTDQENSQPLQLSDFILRDFR